MVNVVNYCAQINKSPAFVICRNYTLYLWSKINDGCRSFTTKSRLSKILFPVRIKYAYILPFQEFLTRMCIFILIPFFFSVVRILLKYRFEFNELCLTLGRVRAHTQSTRNDDCILKQDNIYFIILCTFWKNLIFHFYIIRSGRIKSYPEYR